MRMLPRSMPMPIDDDDDPHLEGFIDDVGKYANKALPIVETILPIVAPATLPLVVAERAIREGIKLKYSEAKKATEAATAIGKAIAATQTDAAQTPQATSSSMLTANNSGAGADLSPAVFADAARKPAASTSNSSFLLVGGVIALLLFIRR